MIKISTFIAIIITFCVSYLIFASMLGNASSILKYVIGYVVITSTAGTYIAAKTIAEHALGEKQ